MNRRAIFALGLAAVLCITWLWHGPMGTGDRFADAVDRRARKMLDHYEMLQVQALMERAPLTRRVILSGPADDFQRSEIKRLVEEQPGVGEAVWNPSSLPAEAVP